MCKKPCAPHGPYATPPTGIRSLDLPTRTKSLYRLSYPGLQVPFAENFIPAGPLYLIAVKGKSVPLQARDAQKVPGN